MTLTKTSAKANALRGGFAHAAHDAAFAFRAILNALARPGTLETVQGAAPPAPLSPAAGAALLTLCDAATPIFLAGAHDCAAVRDWITFHCGAPFATAENADFALGTWDALQPVSRFAIGLPDYPDRAATMIVEMPDLASHGAVLRGPGIETTAQLNLPETAAFAANRAQFPLGFDCLFTANMQVAGLPRSTIVGVI